MSEISAKQVKLQETKKMLRYGMGPFTDQMSHQAFQFLIFTFYYAVVGIKVTGIMWAFIIFTIWDSLNDPLLGPVSDRTKSKMGRRRFWVLVSLVPFALMNLLLFTPPGYDANYNWKILYMTISIMLYDLVYTLFTIQEFAIFPEMFPTKKERERAAMFKSIITVFGVLIGFVLPTVLINPMVPILGTQEEYISISTAYRNNGILLMVLTLVFGYAFFKYGMIEKAKKKKHDLGVEVNSIDSRSSIEDAKEIDPKEPSLYSSLKQTLKNKDFIILIFGNMFNWFVLKLLTTIVPLYGIHVLGIGNGDIMLTVLLLCVLLSAAIFAPLMEKLSQKYGTRNAFIISNVFWILAFIPFGFLDNQPYGALVAMICMGPGLSGGMYFIDILISDIIDEDEVKVGYNRAGAYYGVNALVHRYSTILTFVAIAVVLQGYGWEEYLIGPSADFEALRTGLKILMVIFPIIGCGFVILFLKLYKLHGRRLEKVHEELSAMHRESIH